MNLCFESVVLADNKFNEEVSMLDKKLKALLKSKNMSITQLSKETGVPKTNLQSWITGSSPNVNQADKVATYFNITLEELIFDRKPKTSIENLFNEILIHSGTYKISVSKLTKNNDQEDEN